MDQPLDGHVHSWIGYNLLMSMFGHDYGLHTLSIKFAYKVTVVNFDKFQHRLSVCWIHNWVPSTPPPLPRFANPPVSAALPSVAPPTSNRGCFDDGVLCPVCCRCVPRG